MRNATLKKQRRVWRHETLRLLDERTQREVAWWARPPLFYFWAVPATALVSAAVFLGWRSLGAKWVHSLHMLPHRAVRYVVR